MESLLDKFTRKLNIKALPEIKNHEGILFHYTSSNNIKSIMLGNSDVVLWASRYDCMNDFSEGTLPEIRFKEVCETLREGKCISEEFYNTIRNTKPAKTDLTFLIDMHSVRPFRGEYDTYITSFSEDDDALAMWNYYSKGNRYEGINIGVRSQKLIDSINENNEYCGKYKIRAIKIIYDELLQREIISNVVKELYSKFKTGDEEAVRYHVSSMLTSLKMLFKNKCFEHEKEVRVVVQVFKKYKDLFPVKYRVYAGFIIPYIELRFQKSAICQITTGPMYGTEEQKQLQMSILHEMLEAHDYYVLEKCSKIPVRY